MEEKVIFHIKLLNPVSFIMYIMPTFNKKLWAKNSRREQWSSGKIKQSTESNLALMHKLESYNKDLKIIDMLKYLTENLENIQGCIIKQMETIRGSLMKMPFFSRDENFLWCSHYQSGNRYRKNQKTWK
jgi:hypothetical protein